jgi:hypothetical protein
MCVGNLNVAVLSFPCWRDEISSEGLPSTLSAAFAQGLAIAL